jgi:glycosyltransferase involved in cell wall biosynthesis
LLEAFARITIPYGFSVHDFFLACPSTNLLDGSGNYCGAITNIMECQKCLDEQISFADISIKQWRLEHEEFLFNSAFISAPSLWARNTFNKYFPEISVEVIPNIHHLGFSKSLGGGIRCFLLPRDEVKHIGIMGAIGPVKGARNLEKLVERTRERKLPLRWIIIGYTDRQYEPYQSRDCVLTIHGPYEQEKLIGLLNHYNISLVVFPSAGPETFCYTLSEAWAASKPVLVPPIGALKERVEREGAGWIMEDWKDMDKILDQIMDLAYSKTLGFSSITTKEINHHFKNNENYIINEIENLYRQFLAPESIPFQKRISPLRVYEGARHGAGVDNIRNKRSLLARAIGRIMRQGIRFRYTAFGKWIERKLPASWHYRLRRLLLQS